MVPSTIGIAVVVSSKKRVTLKITPTYGMLIQIMTIRIIR